MWDLLQRYRGFLLVGALIVAPLILLYAQTRAPDARGPVVGLVIDGASLVERALLWATGGVSDVLQEYVTSVASYDELLRLRRDERSAASLRARIAELEHENEVLRGLAHVAQRVDGPRAIGARVIGRSGAPLTRILRIDRGRYDGIERGDGVVTARGVLGRVLATGRHSSDVLLLTDPSAAVDVVSQRTRARGIVRGTGEETSYRVRVEDFDRLADVRVGDALVTSGLGGKFPTGLLVGEVHEVALREDGLYQIADVRPAVDVARVELVLILVRRDAERLPRLGGLDEGDRATTDAGPTDEQESDPAKSASEAATRKPTRPAATAETTPKPAATTPKPAETTPKPAETTPKPAATTPKPAETTPKPAATTPKPAATTPKPAATTPKPAATTTKPAATTTKPAATTPKPAATTTTPKPAETTPKPAVPAPAPTPKPEGTPP